MLGAAGSEAGEGVWREIMAMNALLRSLLLIHRLVILKVYASWTTESRECC